MELQAAGRVCTLDGCKVYAGINFARHNSMLWGKQMSAVAGMPGCCQSGLRRAHNTMQGRYLAPALAGTGLLQALVHAVQCLCILDGDVQG